MEMCSDGHEQIVIDSRTCPLCEANAKIDSMNDRIDELKDRVGELESEVLSLETDLQEAENKSA